MKRRTLTALMALALVGAFALAQPAPNPVVPEPAAKPQAPMAHGMQRMQGMMAQAMPEMTPEQLDKMDALRTAQLKVMLPLRTDVQVKEIELAALWRADQPDANKIIAKVKEIADVRVKMEVARINHMLDIRKLLTPEQLKAMKKMGMGRGMMGRGMGQGRRGMMRGWMGGQGRGLMGQSDDPPGPMMGQAGQQGCPCGNMH